MQKIILVAAMNLMTTSVLAATQVFTCGNLIISDVCNASQCSVALQVSEDQTQPEYVKIAKLNGQSMTDSTPVEQMGLFENEGFIFCVGGDLIDNQMIENAITVD